MDDGKGSKWVRNLSVPPADMLKVLILEKREAVLDAFESYNRLSYQNIEAETYEIKSRLITLFYELQGSLIKDMKDTKYIELRDEILGDSSDIKSLKDVFIQLSEWLYSKRVTQFDNRKDRHPKSVEEANKYDGFG